MSSIQLVKESEWDEGYISFIQELTGLIDTSSKKREEDIIKQNPDDSLYQLADPKKYCDSCGRRLFNFEVIWDESNDKKDEHCCEICWLITK
jgi:hypothetical protein